MANVKNLWSQPDKEFFTKLAEREKKKSNYHISICQQVSNTSDLQLVFKKQIDAFRFLPVWAEQVSQKYIFLLC